MVFGPCGGVRPDSRCELDDALPCPWCEAPGEVGVAELLDWPDPAPPRAVTGPRVLTDLSVPPYDVATLRAVAARLAPVSDALLVGEHHDEPDFPPAMMATEILAAGTRPWITLTCRDRNRVVLEQELAGLAALGVENVLCVTGDGRGYDVRPEVTQVFDLDSTRLTALARSVGLAPAVALNPAAPPVDLRPRALAAKQRAGAVLAVSNHVASPAVLADFLARARAEGADLPVVGAVAVYTDAPSASALSSLPGLDLDADTVAAVLDADDTVEAGIAAAVAEARALLAVPGVVGVNLSGRGSGGDWIDAAEVKAEVARRVRVGTEDA